MREHLPLPQFLFVWIVHDSAAAVRGPMNVYERFIEEMSAVTIQANEPAVSVVGRMTRAVKRAQMVVDNELPVLAERTERDNY